MAGLPGYPSNQSIASQAAAAAGAAVPTVGSINQQYNQGAQDTSGFTRALIQLLRGTPSPGQGYMQAEQAQNAIDSAAANRLAALGSPYAGGSAAAVQGMGNSALSSLLARGAAASTYGAKMPGVAAARGQLAQQTLQTNRQNALTQRGQAYTQAYQQALQQARSNALAYSTALGNYNLNNQKLAQQNAQFNAELGLNYAKLNAQQQEFAQTYQLNQAKLAAALRTTGSGTPSSILSGPGGLASATGLTPNEVQTEIAKASKIIGGQAPQFKVVKTANGGYQQVPVGGIDSRNYWQRGMNFGNAINDLVNQGISRPVALWSAARLYAQAKNAPIYFKGQYSNAYLAYNSFLHWMVANGFKQFSSEARLRGIGRARPPAKSPGGKPLTNPP